jgi:hypothetical protein
MFTSTNTESGITVTYQDATGDIDLTVNTLNQDTTGLAGTATALATARTIGGTSFDGTADIAVGLAGTATALATARTIHGVSFDGTANIDLSEEIADTIGAMVGSNTESGIAVAYQDGDNTLDFTVATLNQDTTGLAGTATALATARTIGGTSFDGTANIAVATATEGTNVTVSANNSTDETVYPTFVDGATGTQGIETDTGLTYNPSTGVITATQFTGNVTGNVTGNTSGTAATVTTAAQTNITSLGTLTALTVDGAVTVNDSGNDVDFRVESDGNANMLFVDGGNDRVGIANNAPAAFLDIATTGSTAKPLAIRITNAASTNYAWEIWRDNTDGDLRFGEELAGTDTTRVTFESGGNVGIGTVSPVTALTVATAANISQVALTSSSNAVAWDAEAAANAYHLTTENTTFSAPSNANEGAIISVEIAQGGTARTIAWNTIFEFAASTAPTMTATASKTDIYSFRYNGSVWQEVGRVQNMAQT